MNTQIACLIRGLFWIGLAALIHYFQEPISIPELLGMLGMWEFIIASCPFLKRE